MLTLRETAAMVRELRDEQQWSQFELARRARVSRSFVADLEAGKPTVEAGKLFDVFQALGYEVALRHLGDGSSRW